MHLDMAMNRSGEPLPPLGRQGLRYVVAANGIFLERRTGMYSTRCRVESIPLGLEPLEEYCRLDFLPIPTALARSMIGFFRHAFRLHGGEAALILLYNPQERRFCWYCPEQRVRIYQGWRGNWNPSSAIEYDQPLELPPGYLVVGDAHSHADLPAYSSAVDRKDERFKDGLHIIAGSLHRPEIDFHIDFLMDDRRFELAPEAVFGTRRPEPFARVPEPWKARIVIERIPYQSYRESDRSWPVKEER